MQNQGLLNIIDNKFLIPIKELNNSILYNKKEIEKFLIEKVQNSNNKEAMLLNFRRGIEMLVKEPLLITVETLSTNKVIVVRDDNFLQLVDDRYYSKMKLSSFMSVFKIETNDFRTLSIPHKEPHIKLMINYIQTHYNTTFRKFMNRNEEYYYMYKFFFDNGEGIKEILDYLNAYHYDIGNEDLYEAPIDNIKEKLLIIIEEIFNLLEKI